MSIWYPHHSEERKMMDASDQPESEPPVVLQRVVLRCSHQPTMQFAKGEKKYPVCDECAERELSRMVKGHGYALEKFKISMTQSTKRYSMINTNESHAFMREDSAGDWVMYEPQNS